MTGVIDGHLHLWDPGHLDYPWLAGELRRPFLQADLNLGGSGVTDAVFVQADCLPAQGWREARWVSSLAGGAPRIAGIVAFAPVERGAAVRDDLDRLRTLPLVRGVRRNLQDEPDEFLRADAVVDGLRAVAAAGLTFDACVTWRQLPLLARLTARVPELVVVVDHLGKPPVLAGLDSAAGRRWRGDLSRLAARDNIAVKLSGLAPETRAGADLAALSRPFLDAAIEVFGPRRCLVGSDWPISAVIPEHRAYDRWFHLVLDQLEPRERAAVARGTARRVYALPPETPGEECA